MLLPIEHFRTTPLSYFWKVACDERVDARIRREAWASIPVAYTLGEVEYALNLIGRIAMIVVSLFKVMIQGSDDLYHMRYVYFGDRVISLLQWSVGTASAAVGLVCPPLAYVIDSYIFCNRPDLYTNERPALNLLEERMEAVERRGAANQAMNNIRENITENISEFKPYFKTQSLELIATVFEEESEQYENARLLMDGFQGSMGVGFLLAAKEGKSTEFIRALGSPDRLARLNTALLNQNPTNFNEATLQQIVTEFLGGEDQPGEPRQYREVCRILTEISALFSTARMQERLGIARDTLLQDAREAQNSSEHPTPLQDDETP